MFFCAASCCALKDIYAVPFSFYLYQYAIWWTISLVKTAKRWFFATSRADLVKKETVEKFF
ncbi:hypothetical protein ATN83_5187 [Raoultella ornithinolytica]|nr:hypothetical protein ATN83_5187 [Raoultella ornithinolytica]KDV91211.1 hypothetical protein AB00_4938 [Raoultella ornithinolytica 2-156-04_S1_C1]KDX10060.1 hypothetical protein AB28_5160 [Raoultella ornithinolytica 2-156-04_S1_C2]